MPKPLAMWISISISISIQYQKGNVRFSQEHLFGISLQQEKMESRYKQFTKPEEMGNHLFHNAYRSEEMSKAAFTYFPFLFIV